MFKVDISGNIKAPLGKTKSFRVTKFGSDEPVTNDAGENQWEVSLLIIGDYGVELIPVRIWAKTDPLEGSSMGDSVELAGCSISVGYYTPTTGDRRKWWRVDATSMSILKEA